MFRFPPKGDYAVGAFSALDFLMRAQRAGGRERLSLCLVSGGLSTG